MADFFFFFFWGGVNGVDALVSGPFLPSPSAAVGKMEDLMKVSLADVEVPSLRYNYADHSAQQHIFDVTILCLQIYELRSLSTRVCMHYSRSV